LSPARVLLFTGTGGAGTTSVAAATALRCADHAGRVGSRSRTLLVAADRLRSLEDALARPLGAGPTTIADGLWGGGGTASPTGAAVDGSGLAALVGSGAWDTVVVDGAPDVLLDHPLASVRLVVVAESRALAEARRVAVDLALHGRTLDSVVANRLLPDAVADPWFDARRAAESRHLAEVDAAVAPLPVRRARLAPEEVVGIEALRALGAELYGDGDPAATGDQGPSLRITRGDGGYDLALRLPWVTRDEVDLARQGDELLVSVGHSTRRLELPDSLRRRRVTSARIERGVLVAHFADPS
jgi:arsenite-transporting ATPase